MNRLLLLIVLAASFMLTGCGAVMDIAGSIGGNSRVYSKRGQTTTTARIPDDSGAPAAELGSYGEKTNPYTVMGKRYYPLKSASGYDQVGTASWYGSENHGMQTASGSIYNMYSMSAAHKTLPLGTIVRVTNLENRSSVDLLVNDRGPFVGNRIIDLSYGAARRIGFADKGLAKVRVQAIGTHSSMVAQKAKSRVPVRRTAQTPKAQTSVEGYFVQVGAFSKQGNALEVRDDLRAKGYSGSRIETRASSGRKLYLVKAGPFSSKAGASHALSRLRSIYPSSFIAAL